MDWMMSVIVQLRNVLVASIDWHCVALWAEVVGYGLALVGALVLRFNHPLHLAAYGLLLGLKVVKAVAGG